MNIEQKLDQSGIQSEEVVEVVIRKGPTLELKDEVRLSKLMPEVQDSFYLEVTSIFLLYEKYYTIEKLNLKYEERKAQS